MWAIFVYFYNLFGQKTKYEVNYLKILYNNLILLYNDIGNKVGDIEQMF